MPAKVLVVIGSQTQGLLFKHLLEQQGLEAVCVDGVPAAREVLAEGAPAALLADSSSLGAEAMAELRALCAAPMLALGNAPLPPGVQRADGADPLAVAAAVAALASSAPAPTPHALLGRARILVVDDSVTYREFLRMELETEGCQVLIARNGEEAEEALQAGGFDCVLLDLVMPGTDGVELCRRFDRYRRDQHAMLPILMLTSQENDQQLIACLEAGADAFLGKSRPMEVLKAKVMALVRCKFFIEDSVHPANTPIR